MSMLIYVCVDKVNVLLYRKVRYMFCINKFIDGGVMVFISYFVWYKIN